MNWKNKKVLVTGAGGFIGSHLTEALLELGAAVRAFVRYTSRGDSGLIRSLPPERQQRIEIVRGDLRDSAAVAQAMEACEIVFHLGALIAIPYSYVHPREVIETNVLGTLSVLEAARKCKPARLVHTSTSEVYGTAQRVPIDETHPLQGQSPYSASKIGADKIVESFFRAFGVPAVTIRPFNTYGPRQSARAVIPAIMTQLLAGKEVRIGKTSPTRDFTYVADTVQGMLRAAEADGVLGAEFNLGCGQEISIEKLLSRIMALTGKSLPVVRDEVRLRPEKSEVDRLMSDNSQARARLNWQPTVSLDEGLGRTWDWIQKHADFYTRGGYQL